MKHFILPAIAISLFLMSCKQTETKVETSENPDGTVTTTTIETNKSTGFDSTKINNTVDKTKEKLNVAGEKIDAAAEKAGDKLNEAGKDIKEAAKKGADKVQKSVDKANEDLQKK